MTRFRNFSPSQTILTWLLCAAVLGPFLIYPVVKVIGGALFENGEFQPQLLLLPLSDRDARQAMLNAFGIGILATLLSSVIAVPLAYFSARLRFAGKNFLTGLLLVPLLLPPLVGAVGLKQMLGREGVLNSLAREIGLLSQPIEWMQMQIPMIVIVMALHLYPLIYLNLTAAWSNIDPTLEEAAENLGAGSWHLWRSVTLPLLLPGFMAGALIVFIFAFTDLGTPLVFDFNKVIAVQIFDARSGMNTIGYVLALWMTVVAALVFWASRRFSHGAKIATLSRAATAGRERDARGWEKLLVYGVLTAVIFLALLPHIGVLMASFARDWTARIFPEWTTENYVRVFTDPTIPAANAIKISLMCAGASMILDMIAGFFLAYMLVRGKVWGAGFLDTLAMLPLALPGLVLAFGLLTGYVDTPLDPILGSPLPLLIIAYAVRRLPYALRSVSGGLQQMSVTLEEASWNLGASPLQTVWRITRPLVTANLLAAGLLTFAFAVLEVSDSLILAANRDYAPIAQAIYLLSIATSGGTFLACALGAVGMLLLTATFMIVNKLLGKQLGALFRA